MRYNVTFTLGGCVVVDAISVPDAMEAVEGMTDKELLILSNASLEIQSIEEVTK